LIIFFQVFYKFYGQVGNAGVGKSVLTNYLLGSEITYKVKKNSEDKADKLNINLEKISKIIIDDKFTSTRTTTLFPKLIEGNDFSFCDLPDLFDSRSEEF